MRPKISSPKIPVEPDVDTDLQTLSFKKNNIFMQISQKYLEVTEGENQPQSHDDDDVRRANDFQVN